MNKENLIQLKRGSTISFIGNDLGYTGDGITISFALDVRALVSQRYKTPVGMKLVSREASVATNIWELSSANRTILYAFKDGEPSSGVLIVSGQLKNAAETEVKYTFYNAFLITVGNLKLEKSPNSISVAFRCVLNASGNLFNVEEVEE